MKIPIYILFFLQLLILQFCLASSNASVFDIKEIVVSKIEFSETSKPYSDFSKPESKENHIFEPSFHDNVSCPSISFCAGYAELVESWKVNCQDTLKNSYKSLIKNK